MYNSPKIHRRGLVTLALIGAFAFGCVWAPTVALADEVDVVAETETANPQVTVAEPEQTIPASQDDAIAYVEESSDESTSENPMPSDEQTSVDEQAATDQEVGDPVADDVTVDQTDDSSSESEPAVQDEPIVQDELVQADPANEETPSVVAEPLDKIQVASDIEEDEEDQTIKKGSYVLSSALNKKKVLNVKDKTAKDGSNVNISTATGASTQRWSIRYVSDGFYNIFKYGTKLALSVLSGKASNGANVGLEKANGSDGQLWKFVNTKGLLYTIISRLNPNYVLDIKGASTKDGTNVRLLKNNGSKEQQFRLYSADPAKASTVELSDGTYTVKTSGSKGLSVDVKAQSTKAGANVQLSKAGNALTQRFHFDSDGKGYYVVSIVGSGKVLSVKNAVVVPTNNVIQTAYTGANTQKWALHKTADGYQLVNKATNLALEISGGKYTAGTNLMANASNSKTTQSYTLSRVYLLSEGIYEISNALAKAKVVEVKGGSSKNGATIQLNADADTLRQRFAIERVDNTDRELYFIRTAASGGLLSFRSGKLVQYGNHATTQNNTNTWELIWNGTFFSLKNLASGKVLGLKGGKTGNGTAITLVTPTSKAAQNFSFTKANLLTSGTYVINSSLGTVLGIKGSSKKNGANVEMQTKAAKNGQYFVIKATGKKSNIYVIRNRNSGLALSVKDSSTANKGNVDQEKYAKRSSQKWEARISDGGYIMFVNLNSGKALGVQGANTEPGSNAQQYKISYKPAQQWQLQPIGWRPAGDNYYYYYDVLGKAKKWKKSVYSSWVKIKNLKSKKKYLAAIDRNHTYTSIFTKRNGIWEPFKAFLGSVGAHQSPTPVGLHKVFRKSYHAYYEYNGVNQSIWYWTHFGPDGQAFHSILYAADNPNVITYGALGGWNSHGCVRLPINIAKWVYNNVQYGSLVYVY